MLHRRNKKGSEGGKRREGKEGKREEWIGNEGRRRERIGQRSVTKGRNGKERKRN